MVEPNCVKTDGFRVAFECGLVVDGWNGIKSGAAAPSDDCTVSSIADDHKFASPIIINMIQVDALDSRLGDVLGLFQMEFGPETGPLGSSDQLIVQIVTLEDIIEIEMLHFIWTNG